MSDKKFATAINCMDGRVQIPVIEWLKQKYGVDYVDMITEPGPIKILAENKDTVLINSIKRRIQISVNKHGSKVIAVIGHYDCAANPVDKDVQIKQTVSSIKIIKLWNPDIEVLGLWVDENWKVYKTNE